jgi:WD40 repeat protein
MRFFRGFRQLPPLILALMLPYTFTMLILTMVLTHHLFLWDWDTCTLNTTTMNSMARMFNLLRTGHSFEAFVRLLSGRKQCRLGCDNTIEMVDANTGEVIHTLRMEKDDTSWITSISFSPDGLQIISGTNMGELCRYDIKTGIIFDSVKIHDNPISSLLFSSDETKVISRSRSHQFVSHTQTLAPVDMDSDFMSMMGQPASSLHLRRDGWVVDLRNKPVCWVPAENRAYGWQSAAYGSQILLGGLKLTLIDISAVL